MAYVVVPQEASAGAATVWLGGIDEAFETGRVRLVSALGEHPLPGPWQHWDTHEGVHRLDYQRVTIPGLQPRTLLPVQLLVNGQAQAEARLTTLPDHLPTLDEKPL
jgi:hypothetical protein